MLTFSVRLLPQIFTDKLTINGSRIDISYDFGIDLGRLSHCEISHRDIHNRRDFPLRLGEPNICRLEYSISNFH